MTAPGWYPDPTGSPTQRYYDGQQWTASYAPVAEAAKKKQLNWLFVVLAGLSAVPTLFFGTALVFGDTTWVWLIAFLWCAMWTFVWWSLRHR